MLQESEIDLLEIIGTHPGIFTPSLVELLKGKLSKPHIYLLTARLKERGLLQAEHEDTGTKQPGPLPQSLRLTHKGHRVHELARQLQKVLEDDSVSEDAAATFAASM